MKAPLAFLGGFCFKTSLVEMLTLFWRWLALHPALASPQILFFSWGLEEFPAPQSCLWLAQPCPNNLPPKGDAGLAKKGSATQINPTFHTSPRLLTKIIDILYGNPQIPAYRAPIPEPVVLVVSCFIPREPGKPRLTFHKSWVKNQQEVDSWWLRFQEDQDALIQS